MLTPCNENSVGDFGRNTNDGTLMNSEFGHAFFRKQFISMDRAPLVIFKAYLMIYFFNV